MAPYMSDHEKNNIGVEENGMQMTHKFFGVQCLLWVPLLQVVRYVGSLKQEKLVHFSIEPLIASTYLSDAPFPPDFS